MKEYFYKKEYKYIYLEWFSYSFAYTLIETYGTVMLYKNGLPIWLILLIFGLRFGITGFVTPLFMILSSKLGIAKCNLISNIFGIISSFIIINSTDLKNTLILFIIVMGINGLSNPTTDALSSQYIDREHKGRFNSFFKISKIIGQAMGSALVTWGVITNNNIVLLLIIIISFLLQYVFIRKIDYKPQNKKSAFKSSIKYILNSKNKYKYIYSLRASHIIERQFVPLYVYLILKDFTLFSSIIIISLVLQIITIILIGKYSDKNISKSNNLVTIIKIIVTIIFVFAKNKITISLNKSLSDNLEKVYETSIDTSIQNIIKQAKEDNELLSVVGQMSLCFTEVLIFTLLAFVAKFIGEKVFYIIFILSIISTIAINLNIKLENKM